MSKTLRVWRILGAAYPVKRKKMDSGEEGEYAGRHGEIRISKKIPAHRFWEVESHEVFHAVEDSVSVARRLTEELGLNDTQTEKVREIYAGTVLPVFLDTLERNGCLTRPEPPKECK